MTDSSRQRLELALARIADPAGEGHRSCLTVYAAGARRAADEADERARADRSLGPLDGRVVTIKDLFDVQGEVTRAGSAALAARAAPAIADAPVVRQLRAAGAVIVAKTNMTELAFSGIGRNPHFGTPGNPADRTRIPGGSTSGGAVACADGIGSLAVGTDTGGSTRIPAALCGLVGFKPTARRVSTQGVYPLSRSMDSVGPLAHTVAECFDGDAVLAGAGGSALEPASLVEVRIGVLQGLPLDGLDAIVASCFERTLGRLAAARCRDVTVDALQVMTSVAQRGGIVPPEAYLAHAALLQVAGAEVDPIVRARILAAEGVSREQLEANLRERATGIAQFDGVFEQFDVLALPTTAIVAPTLAEVASPDVFGARNLLLLRNTSIANFFDLCAISLPMRCGQPLPCGLMLLGRSGADRALFQVAAALEAALSR